MRFPEQHREKNGQEYCSDDAEQNCSDTPYHEAGEATDLLTSLDAE